MKNKVIIGNLEFKSFTLYGDWAELFLDSLPDFYSAYSQYQMALTKITEQQTKEISHEVSEYQRLSKTLKEIDEKISQLPAEEQIEFVEQKQQYEKQLQEIGVSLASRNSELALPFGYSEEEKKYIKEKRDEYRTIRDDLIAKISNGLKKEDRETQLYSIEQYEQLPPGQKETLIYSVAKEEDNGVNTAFLAKLGAVLKKA